MKVTLAYTISSPTKADTTIQNWNSQHFLLFMCWKCIISFDDAGVWFFESLCIKKFCCSELLHHNIWEVLARNFPGQFAIINKKNKKERKKEIQTSFPRLWREKVAYIWSQRSSCTRFTNHHVHGQKTEASRENNYWHLLDLKDAAASSRHYQNRRTRFQLFCFVSRTLFECGEVCQWGNVGASWANNSSHLRSSELMHAQFQWCFAAWRKFCCLLRFVIARNFVFDLSIKIIT